MRVSSSRSVAFDIVCLDSRTCAARYPIAKIASSYCTYSGYACSRGHGFRATGTTREREREREEEEKRDRNEVRVSSRKTRPTSTLSLSLSVSRSLFPPRSQPLPGRISFVPVPLSIVFGSSSHGNRWKRRGNKLRPRFSNRFQFRSDHREIDHNRFSLHFHQLSSFHSTHFSTDS